MQVPVTTIELEPAATSAVKRGQKLEAEANFWRLRPMPRSKIIMKKHQIMINNIRFKIIAGKINKIPKFYTIFVG